MRYATPCSQGRTVPGSRTAHRPGAAEQDHEGGLERILGRVHVAEHLLANRQNHRPVACQDGLESGLGRLISPRAKRSSSSLSLSPTGVPAAIAG